VTALRNSIVEFCRWLKAEWVAEVPDDLAVCEFECRKSRCSLDDWAQCVHRVSSARNELVRLRQSVGDANHRHVT